MEPHSSAPASAAATGKVQFPSAPPLTVAAASSATRPHVMIPRTSPHPTSSALSHLPGSMAPPRPVSLQVPHPTRALPLLAADPPVHSSTTAADATDPATLQALESPSAAPLHLPSPVGGGGQTAGSIAPQLFIVPGSMTSSTAATTSASSALPAAVPAACTRKGNQTSGTQNGGHSVLLSLPTTFLPAQAVTLPVVPQAMSVGGTTGEAPVLPSLPGFLQRAAASTACTQPALSSAPLVTQEPSLPTLQLTTGPCKQEQLIGGSPQLHFAPSSASHTSTSLHVCGGGPAAETGVDTVELGLGLSLGSSSTPVTREK